MTDARRRGRENHEVGRAFEEWIDMQHEKAGLRGALVHIVHNDPPTRMVHGRVIWEAPGVADYSGCMYGGGVIVAEAKSVAPGARLARSRISTKQAQHLDAVTTCGGNSLAFLLVEFRVEGTIAHHRYAIPWHEVPWKVLKSAESLGENDIAQHYRVPEATMADYLSPYHAGSDRRYTVGERRMSRVYRTE